MTRWLVLQQAHQRGEVIGRPVVVEADDADSALHTAYPSGPPHDRRVWAVAVYELAAEHSVTLVKVRSPEWGTAERFRW